MQTRDENESDVMRNIQTQLHESMNRRFAYVKGHSALTLLDPRFNSTYLNSEEVDITTEEIRNILKSRENNMSEVKRVNSFSEESSCLSTSTSQSAREEGL